MADESITFWLNGLKEGDELAIERIVSRYYGPIVCLVRKRLPNSARRSGDEEDVALSALNSFISRAKKGQFDRLENRHDLWKLLVTISCRKSSKHIEHELAQKRGSGVVRGNSIFSGKEEGGFERFADQRPNEQDQLVSEECAKEILAFLKTVDDKALLAIAVGKGDGLTDSSIAEQLDCSTKTVQRKMKRLRDKVQQWAEDAM